MKLMWLSSFQLQPTCKLTASQSSLGTVWHLGTLWWLSSQLFMRVMCAMREFFHTAVLNFPLQHQLTDCFWSEHVFFATYVEPCSRLRLCDEVMVVDTLLPERLLSCAATASLFPLSSLRLMRYLKKKMKSWKKYIARREGKKIARQVLGFSWSAFLWSFCTFEAHFLGTWHCLSQQSGIFFRIHWMQF